MVDKFYLRVLFSLTALFLMFMLTSIYNPLFLLLTVGLCLTLIKFGFQRKDLDLDPLKVVPDQRQDKVLYEPNRHMLRQRISYPIKPNTKWTYNQ